jgi:RNA-directed DNA polymerase
MNNKLFAISDTADVARHLKVSPGEINHLVSNLGRHYLRRSRKKLDGSKRILLIPSDPLKLLQRKIYDHILSEVPLLPCVFGGVKGKSPIGNAAVHTGKSIVFKVDIAQCFPSISARRVAAIFEGLGFGREASGLLTKITTWENQLPQGVPTSNALANLALARVDWRITRLKEQHSFEYSRWVDDLTFSGSLRLLQVRQLLIRIIESEGFTVKAEKTKTEYESERQTVTNFVVNSKVNLPKEKISAIKKEVMIARHSGSSLSPSLSGKMYWLRSVNGHIGGPLVKRAAAHSA